MIELTLPWPPSVNTYWRHACGRTYLSRSGVSYRHAVAAAVLSAGCPSVDPPYRVAIAAHQPDRRRRDLDNILKAVLDALEHAGVILDDALIASLRVDRTRRGERGTIMVTIDHHPEGIE